MIATNSVVAARFSSVERFACFTTSRHFDSPQRLDLAVAGERLADLVEEFHGCRPERVAFAGQVHGSAVKRVDASTGSEGVVRLPECDGLVTAERGTMLVMRTADCLPVVLWDAAAGVCAALHAGWRGTRANIVARGIEAMEELGADRGRIAGWIGPAVCGESYEVSEELVQEFKEAFGPGGFVNGRFLDLPALNQMQAESSGLSQGALRWSALCTYTNPQLFHSHRRHGFERGQQYTLGGFLSG
jgi:hypothetical protein